MTPSTRTKFILVDVIGKNNDYRFDAYLEAYKELFVTSNPNIGTKFDFAFKFECKCRPLSVYQGSNIFNKHFYDLLVT